MIASLPPAPPAIVMTLEQAQSLSSSAPTPEEVPQSKTAATDNKVYGGRARRVVTSGFEIGPKTKGRRDASLHSRGNRRKG
jgi:hypothetical protein